MSTFCEAISEEDCKKASYAGIKDFRRFGNFSLPDLESAKKWAKATYFLPEVHNRYLEKIENFVVRPDDVWVVTVPKSGTTWTQEMVWQIYNGVDFEKGRETDLTERFPMLEMGSLLPERGPIDTVEDVAQRPSPRFIKSHLPAPLLPRDIWKVKPKIIYTARNAKDVFVSFYHHYRNVQDYRGDFEEFLEVYMNDLVMFAPFCSHVSDYWHMRNEENILFLTFEEMKKDMPAVIEKTAKFLGKPISQQQINILADHLTFEKMSQNVSVDFCAGIKDVLDSLNIKKLDDDFRFIRNGQVGSYHDKMSPDVVKKFDSWLNEKLQSLQVESELRELFFSGDKVKTTN